MSKHADSQTDRRTDRQTNILAYQWQAIKEIDIQTFGPKFIFMWQISLLYDGAIVKAVSPTETTDL